MTPRATDVLVIGSGIAGLSFALKMAARGRVTLVTKKERARSNTNYAQGGIAAVVAEDDRFELHVRDTLLAGAGLCHSQAVNNLVREGPARVRELIEWGVRFTAENGELSLGREGGHSRRRIVHSSDLTGREIERALLQAVAERPSVEILEDSLAIDLLVDVDPRDGLRRCRGAVVLDHRSGKTLDFQSRLTLLATGGLGAAYRHTTNPEIATGDGVAMAYRAGVALANLEFIQFHPTALFPTGERAVLISEAVRGEGAVLRTLDGEPLMEKRHRHGSLAPRDVVARAIASTLERTGDAYVLLDLSPLGAEHVERRFPGIIEACAERGVDIRHDPIPVVPAAHYACGGVLTDQCGRTTLPGLMAVGEVACTGVHGANRLASNSLLEAVVYSHRAANAASTELGGRDRMRIGDGLLGAPVGAASEGVSDEAPEPASEPREEADRRAGAVDAVRQELRDLMWHGAGIVRDEDRLRATEDRLQRLGSEMQLAHRAEVCEPALVELRNLITVAQLVVHCALRRRESRGLHYRADYPYRDNERYLQDTILAPERLRESI